MSELLTTFEEYLDKKYLSVDSLTQSEFSINYTAWLYTVFNHQIVQNWLANQGYAYQDNQYTINIYQNSETILPTISYKSGGTTVTIPQSVIDAIFGSKTEI